MDGYYLQTHRITFVNAEQESQDQERKKDRKVRE